MSAPTQLAPATLFNHDGRPDPAYRRSVRRAVLGGVLQAVMRRNNWNANDAASAAGIAPMTIRRVLDGLEVRRNTHTALDALLGQPFGTVHRALDDDLAMVLLAPLADVAPVATGADPAGYLDDLAERFRSGTVGQRSPSGFTRPPMRTYAGTAVLPHGGDPARSDFNVAAELIERLSHRPQTELVATAGKALFAALSDLIRQPGDTP